MRVIAGEFKGRRLKAVPGENTRPTTDKVKESIFNMIGPYFDGGSCFDMYSGSGSLAIEAVSRGAEHAFLSEKNRNALQVLKENVSATKAEGQFTILPGDARKNIEKLAAETEPPCFRLVFLDPPYQAEKMEQDIRLLAEKKLINASSTIVCEMDRTHSLPMEVLHFHKRKRTEYGTIAVEIFEAKEGEER